MRFFIARIFHENLGKNLEVCICRGVFLARDFIKNSPKSNGNLVVFENFHKLCENLIFRS